MKKYTVNHHNGFVNEVMAGSLDEVKEVIQDNLSYTQSDISIELNGKVVTTSQWFGYTPTEEEKENGIILERFGSSGFYQVWSDELELL